MQTSVYTVWQQFARLVKQVVPALHGHRSKTLAWLVIGIMLAKSVASTQMAEVLRRVRGTQAGSQERTFSRFLANEAIDPQALWHSFLPVLLAGWARQPEVTLVVDTTPLGDWAILVSFGILQHSRVWPLGWRVMPANQSWEERQYDLIAQFIKSVRPYLGQVQCRMLADSGLAREKLVQLCEDVGWHYLLRIELDKGYYATELDGQGQPIWKPLTGILSEPGQYWQGRVWLWKTHQRQTWLTATWQVGHDAPLVVISDEGAGRHYLCRYRGRMRVEATFQDKKSRGFGLQATHVRDRAHLERLLLLLCLAIWWLARLGAACIHHGQRRRGCLEPIGATRACCAWVGNGSWTSWSGLRRLPAWHAVYLFSDTALAGDSAYASNTCSTCNKCRGERGQAPPLLYSRIIEFLDHK